MKNLGIMARKPVWIPALTVLMISLAVLIIMPNASADTQIQLVIDGKNITASAAPMIKNDRTLVPIRVISEELGAEVTWNNDERSVHIVKGDREVLLRIDRNLIEYTYEGKSSYNLSDVTPQIYNDRTFVPIRLISNALSVGVEWDGDSRTVFVDSRKSSNIEPFFDMKITSVQSGQSIQGTTALQSALPDPMPAGAAQIKYLILSPNTGEGFIVARGNDLNGSYTWIPSMRDAGDKILVSALYDGNGRFLAGDAIPVTVALEPQAGLTGVYEGQVVKDSLSLGAAVNFSATYVQYELTNMDNGKTLTTTEQDPQGTYKWDAPVEFNGNVAVKAIAFDQYGRSYEGSTVQIKVEVPRKLALTGVKTGQLIDKPVTLNVSRNFDVLETEYFMKDVRTGLVTNLLKVSYGSCSWFPGPEISGDKELYVQVKGLDGAIYTSSPVSVTTVGTVKILLQGAGPNQVITVGNPAKLKVLSNVPLDNVKYIMTNSSSGVQRVIGEVQDSSQEIVYTPIQGDGGAWKLQAIGSYNGGQLVKTDEVLATIFTGNTYSAKPIIEKSQFMSLASQMAVDDWKTSGMSASLQTAQAILETGWGQSVPVDKYNGQLSYNLFGIKGSGSAGSVTSNTWEEYNGVTYRIDAKFRAYRNVSESWADHNKLLLTASRYEPYRQVMYDSSLGAWALRRAGYATDSKYPIKLMNIIKQYNLEELDKVRI